jgi:membrane protease YdiL (CAAX protease family)
VAKLSLDTPASFLAMALYTCLLNSLLEEYVWRWFVTAQFERLAARPVAVLASAGAFTLHHVIVLQSQFTDWRLTLIGSLAVFVAGALWSALFLRYRSLWSPWLSHVLVDAAVFAVGARIVFGSWTP